MFPKINWPVFWGFLTVIVLAGLTAQAATPREDAQLAAAASGRPLEEGQILKSGRVARKKDSLAFTLANHHPLTIQDRCSNEVECIHYQLAADLPSHHAFLVLESHYDDAHWLLIDDRDGRTVSLSGVPIFSSDDSRFLLCIGVDVNTYDGSDALEIWRRTAEGPKVEWAYSRRQLMQTIPGLNAAFDSSLVSWNGDAIALDLHIDTYGVQTHWSAALTYDGAAWRLTGAPQK